MSHNVWHTLYTYITLSIVNCHLFLLRSIFVEFTSHFVNIYSSFMAHRKKKRPSWRCLFKFITWHFWERMVFSCAIIKSIFISHKQLEFHQVQNLEHKIHIKASIKIAKHSNTDRWTPLYFGDSNLKISPEFD